MGGVFGGGKKQEAPAPMAAIAQETAAATPSPVVPTASKAMEAQPVQTVFGGSQKDQAQSLFSSRAPGMAQAAQLAKKYLLGQ